MITTHPQQESTFLQDLQTGLDEFQADCGLQADLLLDGTRLFVGDAMTAPGTALWIGWLGHEDLADLPLRGKAEEVVRISVSQALTLDDGDIDWASLQRTPRWANHKLTHLLISVALVASIRNQITGHKPSATEICQILGVLTMYTDRGSAQDFNSVMQVARNLLAKLSREELKDFLRALLADGGSKYDGPKASGFLPKTMHSTALIVRILALLQLMQLPGPAELFSDDEEIWAAEQLQTRFRSNFGLYVERRQADWSDLQDWVEQSQAIPWLRDLQDWVEQSQVIPWLRDLESRCIAHGRKFRIWSATSGSIQHKIQTRAWG